MKLFSSKKSQWKTLVGLVIIVAAILTLIILFDKVILILKAQKEGFFDTTVNKIIFYNDKVMKDGIDITENNKEQFILNDDQIYNILALELKNCHSKTGIFQIFFKRNDFSENKVCLLCSQIKFSPRIKATFMDFQDYLERIEVKDTEVKFIDYLSNQKLEKKEFYLEYGKDNSLVPGKRNFIIDSNKQYVIYATAFKDSYLSAILHLFSPEDKFSVYMTPLLDFDSTLCESIIN